MIIFFVAVLSLLAGYFIYSKFIEQLFGANESLLTPALAKCDNIDYVALPTWRIFLIQFLNKKYLKLY